MSLLTQTTGTKYTFWNASLNFYSDSLICLQLHFSTREGEISAGLHNCITIVMKFLDNTKLLGFSTFCRTLIQ